MTAAALQERIDAIKWCHPLELRGIHTRPQWHVRRRFARRLKFLQLPEDLAGKSVLDIGAWDGFFSFECERRGASRVVPSTRSPGTATARTAFFSRTKPSTRKSSIGAGREEIDVPTLGTFDSCCFSASSTISARRSACWNGCAA